MSVAKRKCGMRFQCCLRIFVSHLIYCLVFHSTLPLLAFPGSTALASQEQIPKYYLEDIEVIGSQRLSREKIVEELGLKIGEELASQAVSEARLTLLGMSLFRSAILSIRKGKKPGWVVLLIELEDDKTIIGPWGLGSTLSLTYDELQDSSISPQTSPFSTRFQLVSRNLFKRLHRASTLLDIDGEGVVREFEIAYGLPRFAQEKVQFDAKLSLVDAEFRYLQSMGFGAKAESQWRYDLSTFSSLSYGLAMYLNRPGRFNHLNMPESVVGPKLGYRWESRLHSFLPQSGYLFESKILLGPGQEIGAILEVQAAATWSLADKAYLTLDLKGMKTNGPHLLTRTEGRFDIPLSRGVRDQAAFFISGRKGHDELDQHSRFGSDFSLGLRYHSSGFIAELSFRYTDYPRRFDHLVGTGRTGL